MYANFDQKIQELTGSGGRLLRADRLKTQETDFPSE